MELNAVICELNPMHMGHKFIFDSAKELYGNDSVNIAVMSGNFTQRCTPAIYDKYTRAEAAVKCGADIVVELPFPWCSSGVEDFALGGVTVAADLGTRRLVFGSETGDTELLFRAADVKSSPEYKSAITKAESDKRELGSATIFDAVMQSFGITEPLGANDKLGMEYIRFGRELKICDFRPIKRISKMKSATELRRMITDKGISACREYMPDGAHEVFENSTSLSERRFNDILFTHCRLYRGDNDILLYASKISRESANADEFAEALPTKKYTAARLRREILRSVIGCDMVDGAPRFTVLLAMNDRGREFLSENKKHFRIPIITKPSDTDALDPLGKRQYEMHLRADELYALCQNKPAFEYIKKHPHVM